jgi:hypothetical protein
MAFESFEIQDHDDDSDFKNAYMAFVQSHQNFDDSFIKKKEKKKDKEKQSLENFIDGEKEEPTVDDIIEDLEDDEQ